MENQRKTILVPWDFTEVAEFAYQHAVNVSHYTHTSITLIHIVKKDKDVPDAMNRLEQSADMLDEKYSVKPIVMAREGNIFKTIGEVASETHAEIVIMGTHGIRGMQKLTGSWALKVIVSSKVPFVVVQAPPTSESFQNVVFPVDHKKESKEKIKWTSYLNNYYKSKYYIVHPKLHDAGFKKNLANNLYFTKKFLDNQLIEYEVQQLPGKQDFARETIEYATSINADLILVLTTKDINFTDYVLGASEQYIIANSAKLPVMCVNPKPTKISGGFKATGG
ncbi:MAG: universal stress protein [Bacteroidota bacterium]